MKEKLITGAVWTVTAKLLVNVLTVISTIVLARILTPDDYGLVAIVMAIIAISESITDLSLSLALIHLHEPTDDHYHTAWTLNFIRGVVLSVMIFSISGTVTEYYGDARLTNIFYVLCISVFISGFANPKIALLKRNLIFSQDFIISVCNKFAAVVVSIAIAVIYETYWALVLGGVAAQIVSLTASYLIISYRPKFCLRYVKEIWSFSVWVTLGKAIATLNWRIDHLLVGGHLGNTKLGYYSFSERVAGLSTVEILQPLENVLYPGFSKLNNLEKMREAYIRAQTTITSFVLPLGVLFAIFSKEIIVNLVGDKWLPAVEIIQVLTCIFAVHSLSNQVQAVGMALGQTRRLFYKDSIYFILRVPIILTGMYYWGLTGIIYSRLFFGSIVILVNMYFISSFLKVSIFDQFKFNFKSIFSVFLMFMLAKILSFHPIFLGQGFLSLYGFVLIMILSLLFYMANMIALWKLGGRAKTPENECYVLMDRLIKKFMKNIMFRL